MEQTKLTPSVTWLKLSECPFAGRIVRAETFTNKWNNTDARITIERGHTQRTMDVYGENKNVAIAAMGDDIREWTGWNVKVDVDTNGKRVFAGFNRA